MPPIAGFRQATIDSAISPSQGRAFGAFLIIPESPPPNFSEPETRAKANTATEIRLIETSEVYLSPCAIEILFIISVDLQVQKCVCHTQKKNRFKQKRDITNRFKSFIKYYEIILQLRIGILDGLDSRNNFNFYSN